VKSVENPPTQQWGRRCQNPPTYGGGRSVQNPPTIRGDCLKTCLKKVGNPLPRRRRAVRMKERVHSHDSFPLDDQCLKAFWVKASDQPKRALTAAATSWTVQSIKDLGSAMRCSGEGAAHCRIQTTADCAYEQCTIQCQQTPKLQDKRF
jgi:hypothetical protein